MLPCVRDDGLGGAYATFDKLGRQANPLSPCPILIYRGEGTETAKTAGAPFSLAEQQLFVRRRLPDIAVAVHHRRLGLRIQLRLPLLEGLVQHLRRRRGRLQVATQRRSGVQLQSKCLCEQWAGRSYFTQPLVLTLASMHRTSFSISECADLVRSWPACSSLRKPIKQALDAGKAAHHEVEALAPVLRRQRVQLQRLEAVVVAALAHEVVARELLQRRVLFRVSQVQHHHYTQLTGEGANAWLASAAPPGSESGQQPTDNSICRQRVTYVQMQGCAEARVWPQHSLHQRSAGGQPLVTSEVARPAPCAADTLTAGSAGTH